ncbi:MAG: translation initiation factor IF-2 [Clostridiales bacterium]|jgi:translation initiation factor IF-2|nr:translation initiation factor IF-2 [Clostridiales bacterium]
MAKVRVHELAKQLDQTSKNIIAKLKDFGVDVKNHMSNIEDSDSQKLLDYFKTGNDVRRAEPGKNQAVDQPRKETAKKADVETGEHRDERLQNTVLTPREGETLPVQQNRPDSRPDSRPDNRPYQQNQHRRDGQQNRNSQRKDGERRDGDRPRQFQPRRDGQSGARDGGGQQTRTATAPRTEGGQEQHADGAQQLKTEGATGRSQQQRADGNSQYRQRNDQRGNYQRKDGQRGLQRRDFEKRDENRPQNTQGDRPQSDRPQGYRRENQPTISGERQNIRREGQPDTPQQTEGQTGQSQTGQTGGYQRKDGQSAYQRRDGQSGTYQRRDGQSGATGQGGTYQRRDGQTGQTGSYPRRDGQSGSGGNYQRRDGQTGQTGSYPRRDGQSGQGGAYQRRDGQSGATGQGGAYQRRDGTTGTYQRNSGQSGSGGAYQRKDAAGRFIKKDEGRSPYPRRDAKPAGVVKKDDKKEQPSKDERKQIFQKSEHMRQEKAKKKETVGKESNRYLGKPRVRSAKKKDTPKEIIRKPEPNISLIKIPLILTVKELAEQLRRSGADVVKALMKLGVMATVNQEIDFETAQKVGEGYNVVVEEEIEVDKFAEAFGKADDKEEVKVERPPVVVVMGHVDHGKTSLLDAIRNTSVTATEAGGITQHIGAYTVSIKGRPITFLDTPGHEAFTAMRMRGAQVTDIAVLVVAADDGVMPQTVEAINHAKAAKVDIIVAINKIDKPGANPDRVKQELADHGILVEEWGGEVISVQVSAIQKTGIEQLLEMITIVAEMKELRANPDKPARGIIIEAQLDKGRGPVATVLVQDGTLKVGDIVVVGAIFGRIRAMIDDKGNKVKKAKPSTPVEILGLADVPISGDPFYVAQNEKQARMLADSVIVKSRVNMLKATPQKVSLDDLFNQIKSGNVKELNIVLKADAQGSVEAVRTSLEKLSNEEVRIQVIHAGVGAISESDVMLASASNAIIIGFNVRPDPTAKTSAETEKVDVRLYRIIYNAIEDIQAAIKGMLDPVFKEKVIGHAEIRQLFKASSVGTIGGSYVTDGKITRTAQVRIVRDGKVVYDGTFEALRRFKDDVREVAAGYECGLLFSKFNDIKESDVAEAYVMEEIER